MKEKYLKPNSVINTFSVADIITTSSGGNSGDGPIELPDIEL